MSEAILLERTRHYRRVDQLLTQKYGLTFQEFVAQRAVQQTGYTWEAEKDAMNWETSVDGMETLQRKLEELRGGICSAR